MLNGGTLYWFPPIFLKTEAQELTIRVTKKFHGIFNLQSLNYPFTAKTH